MSRRSPAPGAKAYEDFRQKRVEHFTNLDRQAANHIAGRNGSVADVLCYLSMLRNAGLINQNDTIAPTGARYQATKGSKELQQEAAHRLPRQILIGPSRIDPADLIESCRSRTGMRSRFGDVGVLPRSFNTADKASEHVGGGLVEAFVSSCRHVIACPRESDGRMRKNYREAGTLDLLQLEVWPVSSHRVLEAFALWKHEAAAAYNSALAAVSGSDLCISSSDSKDEVVAVLELYSRHNTTDLPRLSLEYFAKLEVEFNTIAAG